MKSSYVGEDGATELPLRPQKDVFRLQCEDAEHDRQAAAEVKLKWVEVAKKVVTSIKSAKLEHKCKYKEYEYWSKFGITYPLIGYANAIALTTSSQSNYEWMVPEEVASYEDSIVHLLCAKYSVVDIYVSLPRDLFGKRDYVNLTYPAKRAHYICSILIALRNALRDFDIHFVPGFNNDTLFPDVKITDATSSGCIMIHFGASESTLAKFSRFSPNISNIRISTIYPHFVGKENRITPLYNQRVLRTILEREIVEQITAKLHKKETLVMALALANRWFGCRGLKEFDGLFLACLMAHLLDRNVVVEQQDPLTVLRNFFLAIVNWNTSSAMGLHPTDLDKDLISAHLSIFPVVFLDSTGYLNLANGISRESLSLVKVDIDRSLSSLGDCLFFDAMFLQQYNFYSLFDHYFRLDLSTECLKSLYEIFDLSLDAVDENDRLRNFTRVFVARIHECMGERFDNVYIKLQPYSKLHTSSLLIGFRVGKKWSNPITMGPLATDPEARSFRELWRGKTQLRKFADTRICECMVWADNPSAAVPYSILQFIIVNHFNLPLKSVSWRSALPVDFVSSRDVNHKVISAFAGLSAILRAAKCLPLMITNIQAASSYVRDTEPCAEEVLCSSAKGTFGNDHRLTSQRLIPPYTASVNVYIKLEYSGKWGDEIDGVLHLSTAFYIEIGKYLKENHGLIAVPTRDQLFVIKDNVVFKLVLVLDKVLKILERKVSEVKINGRSKVLMNLEGQLTTWRKQYVNEVRLQASLHSCSTKYSAYGETVQILKKWLSAQYLTGAIHDLVLELIVASVFEDVLQSPPQSPMTAFRRVLQVIRDHNWTARPLFIDLDNAWNEEEIENLEANFVRMRPILPPMVIITNEDPVGNMWTRDNPTPLLLKRIVALSSSMLKVLDMLYENTNMIDMKFFFFNVDMSIYDAVIEIYPEMVVRKAVFNARSTPKHAKTLPVLHFDPVDELVHTLIAHFQDVALFFWNKYGGNCIGIKWKPSEMDVPVKISRCSTHVKCAEEAKLILNRNEVLEGIRILGRGIIKNVYCNE